MAAHALRWRGRLRSDPLELPWGTRYEIELDEVESSAGRHAGRGRPAVDLLHTGTA